MVNRWIIYGTQKDVVPFAANLTWLWKARCTQLYDEMICNSVFLLERVEILVLEQLTDFMFETLLYIHIYIYIFVYLSNLYIYIYI